MGSKSAMASTIGQNHAHHVSSSTLPANVLNVVSFAYVFRNINAHSMCWMDSLGCRGCIVDSVTMRFQWGSATRGPQPKISQNLQSSVLVELPERCCGISLPALRMSSRLLGSMHLHFPGQGKSMGSASVIVILSAWSEQIFQVFLILLGGVLVVNFTGETESNFNQVEYQAQACQTTSLWW